MNEHKMAFAPQRSPIHIRNGGDRSRDLASISNATGLADPVRSYDWSPRVLEGGRKSVRETLREGRKRLGGRIMDWAYNFTYKWTGAYVIVVAIVMAVFG